jgi:hypothetical protein
MDGQLGTHRSHPPTFARVHRCGSSVITLSGLTLDAEALATVERGDHWVEVLLDATEGARWSIAVSGGNIIIALSPRTRGARRARFPPACDRRLAAAAPQSVSGIVL